MILLGIKKKKQVFECLTLDYILRFAKILMWHTELSGKEYNTIQLYTRLAQCYIWEIFFTQINQQLVKGGHYFQGFSKDSDKKITPNE